MKRKTAIKLLMSIGYDRNSANLYLNQRQKQGYTNEKSVYGPWFINFKDQWYRRESMIKV